MRRRTVVAAGAGAALVACTNVPRDDRFDAAGNEGLVVGSITYDSSLGVYQLVVAPKGGGPVPPLNVGWAMWPPLGPLHDDLLNTRGGTDAVAVPAGSYRIVGWSVRRGYSVSRSTQPVNVPFTVERGKATYLGNLHFPEHWDNVALRDRSARDLPALQARHAALKSAPMAHGIAPGTDLQKIGGDYQSRMQGPVFIPIVR